jgi:hypothetical protein
MNHVTPDVHRTDYHGLNSGGILAGRRTVRARDVLGIENTGGSHGSE